MSRRLVRTAASPLAAIALILILGAGGCGDDEEDGEVIVPSVTVETTAPETQSVPTEPPATETTETTPGKKPANPTQPDTPQNDVPPAAGSPEEQFERFCEQNPGACG